MTIRLENITQRVGAEMHLEDIDLSLPTGSITVLLGPTLAGKTSLLRVIAGLDRPTAGRVLVNGQDVTGVGVRRRNVAMVYQQFVNYPSLSVYENIASPLRMSGKLDAAEIDRRVRAAAGMMHIESLLDVLPGQLSKELIEVDSLAETFDSHRRFAPPLGKHCQARLGGLHRRALSPCSGPQELSRALRLLPERE